jgi:branched-subunit amino acid aminotransferase/4-amino-4-deoxychorismate lyase
MSIAFLNGHPASADDLRALALTNYGHFTSMQVRGRAVQGMDLHLHRLQSATRELFDSDLPAARILDNLRIALDAGGPDCSLRLTVFARAFDYRQPAGAFLPDVLVSLSPPANPDKPALQLKSYPFVRPLPHIKHVGTFSLFHYRRLAIQAGSDDALFVAPDGTVSEGSIWNIGFWDGTSVVWPEAPALRGVGEQLLQAGLGTIGIAQLQRRVALGEAKGFRAAFAINASGIQPVLGIDGVVFGSDETLMAQLRAALASRSWQAIG